MNYMKKIWYQNPIIKEAFLYGIIGGTSALLDSLSFILFRQFNIQMYIANFISINLGITLSFFLNTYFNFKKKDKLVKRALRFYVVGYIGLAISTLFLYIFVDLMYFNETIIKLISIVIVAAVQFILNKIFTYGKSLET